MKNDELQAAISHQIIIAPPFALGGYTRFLQALSAVVELHKPYPSKPHKPDGVLFCQQCTDYSTVNWPCGTIRAIEKELA